MSPRPHFLGEPATSAEAQDMFDEDLESLGFVMNASRLWAHGPHLHAALFGTVSAATRAAGLSVRQRGVLVTAVAAALGDSYCSLAWGTKLAAEADPATAASVLRGSDTGLTDAERAMAAWARTVAQDANSTVPHDVQALRDVGFTDDQIFAITVYVAMRIAFSTVNDALGTVPDRDYRALAPPQVLEAVSYGRPMDAQADGSVD